MECYISGFLRGINRQDFFAEPHLFSKQGAQLLSGIKVAVKVFQTPTIADNQKLSRFSPQFVNICAELQKDEKTVAEKLSQNPRTGYLGNNPFWS